MYIQLHNRKSFRPFDVFSHLVKFHLVVVLCLPFLGLTLGVNVKGVYAQGRVIVVTHSSHGAEMLFARAASAHSQCCVTARHKTYLKQGYFAGKMARKKALPQRTPSCCALPAHANPPATKPSSGVSNWFPYPSCTWWADQRYYQLHGMYVPWRIQADAWEWTARAYQFGWHVSSQPSIGAIVDLQPWVQGAYGLGHVAIVERILNDGSVIASNMNWGGNPTQVAYVHFSPGPGVTFITW